MQTVYPPRVVTLPAALLDSGELVFCSAATPAIYIRPLFGNAVPAGFPSPAGDYLEKSLDLNDYMIRNKVATFYLLLSREREVDGRCGH